ncbi:methyltransferase domain-containing protein [sulfur-oxidizing endosymbiont of Gigantopelta aegis]|uniref:methyltransferase domain-containing protein n=1 Tax=sulfur-oxidizing endosymbiont of Gigantopelta aegis TaxID=2794934 RepID=UPI0018DD0295|nr:methyltransferase domain-containing protein [sulfur-oxidizing endosymbiont of Gigantopelta aegis]
MGVFIQKYQHLCLSAWLRVREWYTSELGQALLASEKNALNDLLEQVFGYNLVQLGCLDKAGLMAKSRTCSQYVIESLKPVSHLNNHSHLITEFEQLPIQNHSVDAVILPHTLEFEANPHQILREVERILVAEGKAVFLGFNPYSTWGLWHKYWDVKNTLANKKNKHKAPHELAPLPSCGHLISQRRLRDWLQLLGFDIDLISEYFYRPPIASLVLLNKLEFMEQAGQFSRILPAGGYLLVATKRVSTLTPIRPRWRFAKGIIGTETVETAGLKTNLEPNLDPKLDLSTDQQKKENK